jgi:hypothetical protein
MRPTLVEYLATLETAHKREGGTFEPVQVSLADFRDYASVYALCSARDGNDYAVFPMGEQFVCVVLDNGISLNGRNVTGQGSVNIYHVCDTHELAQQQLIQVMIYDNNLIGIYDHNN